MAKILSPEEINERLFIGKFPCGLVFADRHKEEHRDYKRCAFLAYDTLELDIAKNCPSELKQAILDSAGRVQAMKGQAYQISTVGQTVLLGSTIPA